MRSLSDVRDQVDILCRQMADLHIKKKDKKWHKVMCWLSAPDEQSNHTVACQKHEPGTGLWFLQCLEYRRWKESRGAHLYIYGKAGAGKTVLCSTLIEDLKSHHTNTEQGILASFYFAFSDEKNRTYDALLASMVSQLCVVRRQPILREIGTRVRPAWIAGLDQADPHARPLKRWSV